MNRDALRAELRKDESGNVRRLKVYDDGTGRPLKPGMTLVGHPTIGTGRCLDTYGITEAEDDYLLDNNVDAVISGLTKALPWFAAFMAAEDVRARVLCNMAFNLGVPGLGAFHVTLRCVSDGRWEEAALSMEASLWARQTGPRAARLAAAMRAGS